MKLAIQIPCFNEEKTLGEVLESLPRSLDGIDSIEVIVINDGSTDRSAEIARSYGARVISHISNLGLSAAFKSGIDESLRAGADIIVNIDADNQYRGEDIPRLIAPILNGEADIVIGNRRPHKVKYFSPLKRFLQFFGSFVVRRLSGINVEDAVSGFRAFSRRAAYKLTVLSGYTYTIETLLQARSKNIIVKEVIIGTNPVNRPSRLVRSISSYITFSIATIIRVFTLYNALRVFVLCGSLFVLGGVALLIRFAYFYFTTGGSGHIQSLIIATILTLMGSTIILVGLVADLIHFNRKLIEDLLERVKKIEIKDSRLQ
ncbi:MAG: glycosyltransferase family 2 protein [Candidatus Dadabacteria bacterium]|nr:MAG: glycosyltransferase family 2 protein [Candidatus Dadabacteria bacterium]